MATITVFHNTTPDERGNLCKGMLDGYDHGDALVPVFTTTTERAGGTAADMATLEEIFHLLNVGADPDFGTPDERAVAYRRNRNRSLSVGDVVAIGQRWYACARIGWAQITEPAADDISYDSHEGTTSLVTA
jgi:hypothetical protein